MGGVDRRLWRRGARGGMVRLADLVPTHSLAVSAASDTLTTAPRLSLVVLPFENLSGDKEQDYFADGITDDLTTDLSHLPDSFVIARNTAFTYKGKAVDVKQLGRELGVRYVLEGSVRRVGENITVNAQLISTETGAHVWADRFDGERSKLGELQVDFVARLAQFARRGTRQGREPASDARAPEQSGCDRSRHAWRAMLHIEVDRGDHNRRARDFERALRLDPELPRADWSRRRCFAEKGSVLERRSRRRRRDAPEAWLRSRSWRRARQSLRLTMRKAASLRWPRRNSTQRSPKRRPLSPTTAIFADAYATAGYFKLLSRPRRGRLRGRRNRPSAQPARSTCGTLGNSDLPPPQPFGAMGSSHRMVQTSRYASCTRFGTCARTDLAAAYAWTGRDADARAAVARTAEG